MTHTSLDPTLIDPVGTINRTVLGLRSDVMSLQNQLSGANDRLADAMKQIDALQSQVTALTPAFWTGAASNDWAMLEHQCGTQFVARVYDDGFNLSFPAVCAARGVNPVGKVVVYSFKPQPNVRAADVAALLASVPTGVIDVIFEAQHEASNPKKAYTTDAARAKLRADKRLIYQMALDAGFKTIWIEMDYLWQAACAKANPWRTPENFNPGDDLTTYYGVDTYNNGSLLSPQRWDSYGYAIGDPAVSESLSHVGGGYVEGGFIEYAKTHGKSWIVTEWNTIRRLPTGSSATPARADYLKGGVDYFQSKGARGVCLFDCNGRTSAINGESWPLHNDATGVDYAAWAGVTRAHQ